MNISEAIKRIEELKFYAKKTSEGLEISVSFKSSVRVIGEISPDNQSLEMFRAGAFTDRYQKSLDKIAKLNIDWSKKEDPIKNVDQKAFLMEERKRTNLMKAEKFTYQSWMDTHDL